MAISQAMCTSFKKELLEGKHNFLNSGGHTFKLALFTSSASLGASTTDFSSSNEVSGTGYSAGGATLTRSALQQLLPMVRLFITRLLVVVLALQMQWWFLLLAVIKPLQQVILCFCSLQRMLVTPSSVLPSRRNRWLLLLQIG